MAIPKYDEMYRAFLDCRSDGQPHKSKEVKDNAARVFHVSDADRAALLPSGSAPVFDGRVGWTKTYLKKAGLIQSPSRGVYVLTAEGKQVLAENPNTIDNLYLQRFESFRKFISPDAQAVHSSTSSASSQTPQDVLEEAFQRINTTLADDLLSEIMKLSPSFFEHMVIKLLTQMGYGGSVENAGIVVEQGATKGLFITTARFSAAAYEYAKKQHTTKVVLVDGAALAKLMIEYNLGVSTEITYKIKRIDSDFFAEDLD